MPKSLPQGRRVAPSILSADFSKLGEEIGLVMEAGACIIHVDVMDGHFVPPITIGPLVVEAVAGLVHKREGFLDVHLMIERPEGQVGEFAKAGADSITVHQESTPNVQRTLAQIRELGCLAALALNPSTGTECLESLGEMVDMVLVMSVNPGWAGQAFIDASLVKIGHVRELVPDGVAIEVDGGIGPETASACAGAGATIFAAGSAIFGKDDPTAAYRQIVASTGSA